MDRLPSEPELEDRRAAPTLLLLDADARNARLLASLLHTDGYRVDACRSGAAALVCAARTPGPDAVIVDVSPARRGELEAVQCIHAGRPDLAIFVITAHPQLARSLAQEQLRVFVKPLDYPALLRALAERGPALGRRL